MNKHAFIDLSACVCVRVHMFVYTSTDVNKGRWLSAMMQEMTLWITKQ